MLQDLNASLSGFLTNEHHQNERDHQNAPIRLSRCSCCSCTGVRLHKRVTSEGSSQWEFRNLSGNVKHKLRK